MHYRIEGTDLKSVKVFAVHKGKPKELKPNGMPFRVGRSCVEADALSAAILRDMGYLQSDIAGFVMAFTADVLRPICQLPISFDRELLRKQLRQFITRRGWE